MYKFTRNLVAALTVTFSMGVLSTGSAVAGEHGHADHSHAFDKGMAPVLQGYLKVQQALAKDSMSGIKKAAKSIARASKKLDSASVKGKHAAHYRDLPAKIESAANALGQAKDLEQARGALKKLSMPMAMWGTMSKPAGVDVVFCSMAKASWLQKQGDVQNPYYGQSMLSCGEVVGGAGHAVSQPSHGGHKH